MKEADKTRGRGTLTTLSAMAVVLAVLVALTQRAEAQVASPDTCDDNQGGCSELAYWQSGYNAATGEHFNRANATKGAYALLQFKGTSVKWITLKSPFGGKTRVFLDGKLVKTFDAYSSTWKANQVGFSKKGLRNKKHTIEIQTTQNKNPASGGYATFVDGFMVGSASYEQDSYRITYGADFEGELSAGGAWVGRADSRAFGGSFRGSKSTATPASFFAPRGSGIGIKTAVGPALGEMYLQIEEYDPATGIATPVGYTILDNEAASLDFVTKPVVSYTGNDGGQRSFDPNKQYVLRAFSNTGDLVVVDGWTGDLP